MVLATTYDAINAALFLPSGGSRRLRQRLVDALDVRRGHRVLELGCGTGQVTELLVATGADVVAVDRLPAMISRARQRAPSATFVEGDAIETVLIGAFDRTVLSFVLHNFDAEGRRRLLGRAASALAPGGRIGVLEWALPSGRLRARIWRRFLNTLEPSPSVKEVLEGAVEVDAAAVGLRFAERLRVAGGRAQIAIAELRQ